VAVIAYPDLGHSLFVDGPLNQSMANKYGIIISTSHHEFMQRATSKWLHLELDRGEHHHFFRDCVVLAKSYESYVSMRGAEGLLFS
jgi:hypothetical protein